MARSPVDHLVTAAAHPRRRAVLEPSRAHTRRRVAPLTHDHHVREVDRRLFLDDAAGLLRTARLLMALHHVQALDHDPVLLADDPQHLAGLAALLAGDDHDRVVLADPAARWLTLARDAGLHQSTSGASEMIFMNFFARSSRATGPKMRVPIGSRWLSISTAELLSKRMYEPSGRPTSFAVRTITAFITSPFFTLAFGIASFTDTTMTSPMDAYFRLLPPRTLMHSTLRAPELSATSSTVSAWITTAPRC